MRDTFARLTALLFCLPDTPRRTAFAFSLGVFLGFSPFLGFQTLLGLGIAFAFRLSRVAVVAGTWVNLPWFVPLYYVLATEAGAWMLGQEPPSRLGEEVSAVVAQASLSVSTLERMLVVLRPMLWPFAVGSTAGGLLFGCASYRVMLVLLRARRAEGPPAPEPMGPPDL